MTTITLSNASTMKKKPHLVLRRIKYKSKQKGQRYIDGGTDEKVTFEHLEDAGYMTLIQMRFIEPATNTGGKA